MPSRKVHCVANSFLGSAEVAAGLSNFIRRRVLRRGDWLQTPLRHASNPCGSFSLCASAKILDRSEGATTHHCVVFDSWVLLWLLRSRVALFALRSTPSFSFVSPHIMFY